jgi:nucleoside-triphosphatase THEP1
MFILLTGSVRAGKTTACWKAVSRIRSEGRQVAGFVSPPLLGADGAKVGIEMLDLATGKRQVFARVVEPGEAATVGMYRISDHAIDWAQKVLAAALLSGADWIVVDEIGPLELHRGEGFAFALQPLADAVRIPNAIVVVREALEDELAERLGRTDVVREHVPERNRSQAPARIVKLVRSTHH